MKLTSPVLKTRIARTKSVMLIILPSCKCLQWGQEVAKIVTTTKADDLQSCAETINKLLRTEHLSLGGCNPGKSKTPLLIILPQYQALDTTHLVSQPSRSPQETKLHHPCSLGVMSWCSSPLLGNCQQPHLWKLLFCSTHYRKTSLQK